MAEIKRKRRTRMYEPWGYQDQNNYESSEVIQENDLDSFFADVNYSKDDNKIFFYNKDGEEKGALDVSEFVKSDSIIDKVEYKDGILTITFTNGDEVHIDLTELIDENEFKDGLIVDGHVVKVLVDGESEKWLTVSENGIKVSGIQSEIDRLDDRVDVEISRATAEEERIDSKLDKEIQDRIDDVDAEENRAKAAEQVLTTNLSNEITRATQTEQGLNHRIDVLNDELDSEESARESNDSELSLRITTEVNDRIAAVNAEKSRAEAEEQSLSNRIYQETANRIADVDSEESRAISAETEINDTAIFEADYDSESKTIIFYNKNSQLVDTIDATPFVKDGMIDSVYVDHETNELVIVWNTAAGKQETRIPLSDIFNPDDYYTKDEVNAFLGEKVDKRLEGINGTALIFNETDGGGAKFEHSDGTWSFIGVNGGGESGIAGQIYALKKNVSDKFEGARIDITKDGMYYTVGDDSSAIRDVAENEIATKGNVDAAVEVEELRAKAAEEALDNRIDEITSGGTIEKLDDLIEKLGYKDNDTLETSNEHEVAFGEWNVSNTDVEPSGQTVFSVGIGTSAHDRKNAIEVRKDGGVYMWIEGEFMNINKILGQISHEVYDTNSNSGETQGNG